MYQQFSITTVAADLKNKQVIISCNFDVDPDTVSDATVELFQRVTRNAPEATYVVKGKDIFVQLTDWPLVNTEYVVRVQKIKNILGEELLSGIRRKLIFNSDITSSIAITNPAFDEVVDNLTVKWQEINGAESLVSSYYLEIGKDNAFYNLVRQTEVIDKNEVDLGTFDKGQYFIRCRAQKDNQYGLWSDTVTFISNSTSSTPNPDPIYDGDNDLEPIFEDELDIVNIPPPGETPVSILIEFNKDIDEASLSNILVIRRSI